LSVSVCLALIASLALSFSLVPVLFKFLMRSSLEAHRDGEPRPSPRFNPFSAIHVGFNAGFERFRHSYRNGVAYAVGRAGLASLFFFALMVCSLALFPSLGRDFFPQVDAG